MNQSKIPQGIPNTGNFCYIISSLQALFNNNTIINNLLVDNLQTDEYINILLEILGLKHELYHKDKVIELVNENTKEILKDNVLLLKILNKFNITKETLLLIIDKIKNNIYPIYIYIYFIKTFNIYNNLSSNLNNNNLDNDNEQNKLKKMHQTFMEYIKLNCVVLHNMGITELVDGNQHDAQEYILTIIDILNDSHLFNIPKKLENTTLTDEEINKLPLNKRILIGYKKAYNMFNKNGYSKLKNNLYFYTTQFIDCKNCNYKSISYQENCMLSLPIPNNTTIHTTIYDCLNLYFGIEIMDHEYKCENCNEKVKNNILYKKIISKPDTLIIFFKRFNFNIETMQMSKNNDIIIYPLILNLNKYHINNINLSYKLKSIICHKGIMNYGHYYSYICKNNINNNLDTWFKCNDDTVTQINNINNELINNNNAYILFYEKINN